MGFTIEVERETDGRWIAEIPALPGVMAYGATRDQAIAAAKALALHTIADRIEHGEIGQAVDSISFSSAA
jgi:predicted RNase H-like HicB family nuclease